MAKQKVSTWDMLQTHPFAKDLDVETQLALMCEYVDRDEDLQEQTLSEFIDDYLASAGGSDPAEAAEADEEPEADDEPEAAPSNNGNVATAKAEPKPKPRNMQGMRVVYRTTDQNILSDEDGVAKDAGGVVAFTDVDGAPWSNVKRENVFPITLDDKHYHEVHVQPREAKELTALLDGGKMSTKHKENDVVKHLDVVFPKHPDKIIIAVINGKRPYVDRFVQLPKDKFEDDQKPTTRLFGEHCFRVKGEDHIVKVVSP